MPVSLQINKSTKLWTVDTFDSREGAVNKEITRSVERESKAQPDFYPHPDAPKMGVLDNTSSSLLNHDDKAL